MIVIFEEIIYLGFFVHTFCDKADGNENLLEADGDEIGEKFCWCRKW